MFFAETKRETRTAFGNACPAWLVAALVAGGMRAQPVIPTDFGTLIQSPSGVERVLEYCDNHPDYELTLANWLMNARPGTKKDREGIHSTSVHLFIDTENRQIELGLAHLLIGSPLEYLARDPNADPVELAKTTSRYLVDEVSQLRAFARADRSKLDALKIAIRLQLVEASPRETVFLNTLQRRLYFPDGQSSIASSPSPETKPESGQAEANSLSDTSVGYANRSRSKPQKTHAPADAPGHQR